MKKEMKEEMQTFSEVKVWNHSGSTYGRDAGATEAQLETELETARFEEVGPFHLLPWINLFTLRAAARTFSEAAFATRSSDDLHSPAPSIRSRPRRQYRQCRRVLPGLHHECPSSR